MRERILSARRALLRHPWAQLYPNIAKLIPVATTTHDEGGSVVGTACDD